MIGSYDYAGLIQAFLYQTQYTGSTAGDRLSFSDRKLYSYSSVLAELRTTSTNHTVLFINKSVMNYSNTTKRQVRILKSLNPLPIREWYFRMSNTDNLIDIMIEIDMLIKKYTKARVNKQLYKEQIHTLYDSLEPLFEEYKIDKRTKLYKQYQQLPFKLFANKLLKD